VEKELYYTILSNSMDLSELDNVVEIFNKELAEDLKMDELSIKEKAMLAPVIKHKWVARTAQHKAALIKLKAAQKGTLKKLTASSPVTLSKTTLEHMATNSPELQQIVEGIEKLENIIEFLEKIEKLTSSLTFDYKNVIDLQKLETT
jgi:hypothetical protein